MAILPNPPQSESLNNIIARLEERGTDAKIVDVIRNNSALDNFFLHLEHDNVAAAAQNVVNGKIDFSVLETALPNTLDKMVRTLTTPYTGMDEEIIAQNKSNLEGRLEILNAMKGTGKLNQESLHDIERLKNTILNLKPQK